jgi:RNA polymerase sigma-70 factor (ECF subfamily)
MGNQDRARWDQGLIAEGQRIVRRCLEINRPGPYQIQAAITAVHADARSSEETDWRQILALYDQLMSIAPSPVVALNRAVAVAEVQGPAAALAIVESLDLAGFRVFHAVRADLLRRLGRHNDAIAAYDEAIRRTENVVEREFLVERREELASGRRQ